MQRNDAYVASPKENSESFLAILKIVFWWPVQLILILFDKTKDEFKSGALLFLFIFVFLASGCNLWLYAPVYLLFGVVTLKKNFWM